MTCSEPAPFSAAELLSRREHALGEPHIIRQPGCCLVADLADREAHDLVRAAPDGPDHQHGGA